MQSDGCRQEAVSTLSKKYSSRKLNPMIVLLNKKPGSTLSSSNVRQLMA